MNTSQRSATIVSATSLVASMVIAIVCNLNISTWIAMFFLHTVAIIAGVLSFSLDSRGFRILHHFLVTQHPIARESYATSLSNITVTFAIKTAFQLQLFEYLASKGPRTGKEIAADKELDVRGVEIFLNCLVGACILNRVGSDQYALSPVSDEHFLRGKLSYRGASNGLVTTQTTIDNLMSMRDAVRTGGSVLESHAEKVDHPYWSVFAEQTVLEGKRPGAGLAAAVSGWAAQKKKIRVLDVACGSGCYGYSVAQTYPHAHVTFVDYDHVLPHTEKLMKHFEGVRSEQCSFLAGDMNEHDIGGPYDLVIVSHILHNLAWNGCVTLLQRLAAITETGGRVVINEYVVCDGVPGPSDDPFPTRFSLMMLCWTKGGQAYSFKQYQSMLAEAGYAAVSERVEGPSCNCYVVGSKS